MLKKNTCDGLELILIYMQTSEFRNPVPQTSILSPSDPTSSQNWHNNDDEHLYITVLITKYCKSWEFTLKTLKCLSVYWTDYLFLKVIATFHL